MGLVTWDASILLTIPWSQVDSDDSHKSFHKVGWVGLKDCQVLFRHSVYRVWFCSGVKRRGTHLVDTFGIPSSAFTI